MDGLNPEGVRLEKNLLIPLRDGVNLAADLYLPEGKGPFPTLISIYPYHKDDYIGAGLGYYCSYFALQGYAHLLVDCRGLGSSEGKAWPTVGVEEARDGAETVEWAAQQPWCDGNVGMWGISYGGMISLETASQRPPHLRATVPIFAMEDPYADITYPGGCLNCMGSFGDWGSDMVASNLVPPGHQDPEGRWYEIWKERLDDIMQYMLTWQAHPTFDQYWKDNVIPVGEINSPTFLIGGWRDVFCDSMPRIFDKVSAPKKLVVGPWTHLAPDQSPVEPWDYVVEMTRWWDYWLKGQETGIMEEPPVTLFVQGTNMWKHEADWPIERAEERELYLAGEGRLSPDGETESTSLPYRADPTVGAMAGLWEPTSRALGLPLDQNPDDLLSLTFTTELLEQDLEITGSPEATLYVALESGEDLNLVVKLNDVSPKGGSSLITTGWLKGSHYRSHEELEALKTGRVYEMRVPLWATSYKLAKGHRLRLSISCSDFPRIWPTPTNPEIRLYCGGERASSIRFPVVSPPPEPLTAPTILRPDPAVNRHPLILDGPVAWKIERDLVADAIAVSTGSDALMVMPSGLRVESWKAAARAHVTAERPDGARIDAKTNIKLNMPAAGEVEVEAKTTIHHDRLLATAYVTINGRLFYEKEWVR